MKVISWLAAGGAAGWGAARLTGAERVRGLEAPTSALLSFTPQVAALALLGSPLLRRRGAAATAAAAGAALAAVVLPRAIRRPQPPADGPVLRVLTANVQVGLADEDTVVSLVRRTNADVLFVQELTEAAATRLKLAGLGDLLPYEAADLWADTPRGSAIYARFPLSNGPALEPRYHAQPTARLDLGSGQVADLVCVHARPPTPPGSRRATARWGEDLAYLPGPASPPRVLAGDFNATADHAQFRRLLRRGHVDAAREVGHGLVPTWGPGPHGKPRMFTLDHVLVDPRCAVLTTSAHGLPGSDHRALYAEFRLPAQP